MKYLGSLYFFLLLASPTQASISCQPTAGIQDIRAFGYYKDKAGSIRDDALFKETHALTKPFEEFAKTVTQLSDSYLESGDREYAHCTLAWLDRWAQDRAMLGKMIITTNDQPEYTRKWTHAAAAIAYFKVQPVAAPEVRQRIDAWLKELADNTLAYWDNPKKSRNNHYYWTGVGVMATAVATGDTRLLKRARRVYETGLNDIRDDGGLTQEMKRAGRALHYHNFSAAPLALIAAMAARVGENWFALDQNRFDLLAERVADGMQDAAWFAERSGTSPQVTPPADDVGWMELYLPYAAHPEKFQPQLSKRPFKSRDMGGNLTLMAQKKIFEQAK